MPTFISFFPKGRPTNSPIALPPFNEDYRDCVRSVSGKDSISEGKSRRRLCLGVVRKARLACAISRSLAGSIGAGIAARKKLREKDPRNPCGKLTDIRLRSVSQVRALRRAGSIRIHDSLRNSRCGMYYEISVIGRSTRVCPDKFLSLFQSCCRANPSKQAFRLSSEHIEARVHCILLARGLG